MNRKRIIPPTRPLAALLATLLLGSALPLSSLAAPATAAPATATVAAATVAAATAAAVNDALNYARPDDPAPVEIPADALYASVTAGTAPTAGETAYYTVNGIALTYSVGLPPSGVTYVRSGDGTALIVSAAPYSYVAANGTPVTWSPTSVTVNGQTLSLASDGAPATFTGLDRDRPYEIRVAYALSLPLPAQTATDLIRAPYEEGQAALDLQTDYEAKLAAYDAAVAAYRAAYDEYLLQNNRYSAYQRALATYRREQATYDAYLQKKQAYEQDFALWQAYLSDEAAYHRALDAYDDALADYDAQYAAYMVQYERLCLCRRSLTPIESVFLADSVGHMMYNTLTGPTVDSVLEKQDELVAYGGVDRQDILNAGSSTERLRTLLGHYRGLKSEEEKFDYYKDNYEELKSQFVLLCRSLTSMCENPMVRKQLNDRDRLDRYYQFIAQLYLISVAMDDAASFLPQPAGWDRIPPLVDKTVYDVLEPILIVHDGNDASPLTLTYPTMPPEPVKPSLPTAPTPVKEPKKTWVEDLSAPVAPKPVDPPVVPEAPGARPTAPLFTSIQSALMAELRGGTLTAPAACDDVTLTFTAAVTRMAAPADLATVTFYDYDRTTPLAHAVVALGQNVTYDGPAPTRPADVRYTYRFDGWADESGAPADFKNVREDRCFYAVYTAEAVTYPVTFLFRDKEISFACAYGQMVDCEVEETSYEEGGYRYDFAGWSPAPTPVTGAATYVAVYTATPLSYTATFEVRGTHIPVSVTGGTSPSAPEVDALYVEGSYLYTFVGWSPEPAPADGNATYTAIYRKELLVPLDSGDPSQTSGADVSESASLISVVCGAQTRVSLASVVAYAAQREKGLLLRFENALLRVDAPALPALTGATHLSVRLLTPTRASDETPVLELWLEGQPAAPVPVTLFFTDPSVSDMQVSLLTPDGEVPLILNTSDNSVTLSLSGLDRLYLRRRHAITCAATGDGYVRVDTATALPGQTVSFTCQAGIGRLTEEIFLLIDGEKVPVTGTSFTMPSADVTLCATFVPARYTVVFEDAYGQEICRHTYAYGEMPDVPDAPEKAPEGDYTYAFSRWSPEVSAVTQDVIYRPVFLEGSEGNNREEYTSPYHSERFFSRVVLKYGGIFLLCLLVPAAVVVLVRKKEKN